MYIDSHTHYDIILEDSSVTEENLFSLQQDNQVSTTVHVAIDPSGYDWAISFSKRHQNNSVLFALGIHPSSKADGDELRILEETLTSLQNSEDGTRLLGIGECGLDYYRLHRPVEEQKASFSRQIELSKQFGLPLIIHTRDAMEDTFAILDEGKAESGIFHCFSGNRDDARMALDRGFFISFAGNLTFRKATEIQDAAAFVPLDRVFLETDAPYLTPVPHRGKPNRPHLVVHTYEYLAALKNVPLEKLAQSVTGNFHQLRNSTKFCDRCPS